MKVLGICGSPRKGGNTDILLDRALEGAAEAGGETEKLFLEDMDISPCREEEYENVDESGLSVVDDDIQVVYRKLAESDIIILASPIFFGSLSAQTKTMIDRFQCVWVAKNVLGRDVFTKRIKGAFLCVEATTREDFFENARSIVKHFFATVNAAYNTELFCPGFDRKGSIAHDRNALDEAYELGKRIVSE